MKKLFLMTLLTLVGVSCSPTPDTPEGLLRMYVNDVATKKLGKDYYLKHTTGALKDSLNDVDEEELAKRNFSDKIKQVKVDVQNQNCQESKCVLTYVVSYDTVEGGETSFASETKKIAEFQKVEGDWKIANVTNVKTYHESLKPINPLEEN